LNTSRAHFENQSLEGLQVLVADDDPVILEYLRDLLRSAGAIVETAHDGSEAIERAVEFEPDVVVLDLQMPVIDGFQAARQIRDSVPGAQLIALSAHGLREHKERATVSGFSRFLVKPIDLTILANTILALVAERK
jgi:CheY-like chemotaxis protein